MRIRKALVVVDVQNDFCEGGALAVEGGNAVAEGIRKYIVENGEDYTTIVFTKDWHKPWPHTNGGHFSETPDYVDSWPVHCVQGTYGAEFHHEVEDAHDTVCEWNVWGIVFRKGDGKPDYSGFQGFNSREQTLAEWLALYDIDRVDVVGIAGDYCVKATAFDAKAAGYEVKILTEYVASVGGDDATRAVVEELEGV